MLTRTLQVDDTFYTMALELLNDAILLKEIGFEDVLLP